MIDIKQQYLTDAEGNKIAVVIDIEIYEKLMNELDELYCLKGYEEALAETEPEIASNDYISLDDYLASRENKVK